MLVMGMITVCCVVGEMGNKGQRQLDTISKKNETSFAYHTSEIGETNGFGN